MLYLGLAIALGLLSLLCAKVGYKVFSILLGMAALVSIIAWFRNPAIPTPDIPDNIPIPGGK